MGHFYLSYLTCTILLVSELEAMDSWTNVLSSSFTLASSASWDDSVLPFLSSTETQNRTSLPALVPNETSNRNSLDGLLKSVPNTDLHFQQTFSGLHLNSEMISTEMTETSPVDDSSVSDMPISTTLIPSVIPSVIKSDPINDMSTKLTSSNNVSTNFDIHSVSPSYFERVTETLRSPDMTELYDGSSGLSDAASVFSSAENVILSTCVSSLASSILMSHISTSPIITNKVNELPSTSNLVILPTESPVPRTSTSNLVKLPTESPVPRISTSNLVILPTESPVPRISTSNLVILPTESRVPRISTSNLVILPTESPILMTSSPSTEFPHKADINLNSSKVLILSSTLDIMSADISLDVTDYMSHLVLPTSDFMTQVLMTSSSSTGLTSSYYMSPGKTLSEELTTPYLTSPSKALSTEVNTPYLSSSSKPLSTEVNTPYLSSSSKPLSTEFNTPYLSSSPKPLSTEFNIPYLSSSSKLLSTEPITPDLSEPKRLSTEPITPNLGSPSTDSITTYLISPGKTLSTEPTSTLPVKLLSTEMFIPMPTTPAISSSTELVTPYFTTPDATLPTDIVSPSVSTPTTSRTINSTRALDKQFASLKIPFKIKYSLTFLPEYLDNTSFAYRHILNRFSDQLTDQYKDVTHFKDLSIRGLSNGSIVVDFDLRLSAYKEEKEILNTSQLKEDLDKVKGQLAGIPEIDKAYLENVYVTYVDKGIKLANSAVQDLCMFQDICTDSQYVCDSKSATCLLQCRTEDTITRENPYRVLCRCLVGGQEMDVNNEETCWNTRGHSSRHLRTPEIIALCVSLSLAAIIMTVIVTVWVFKEKRERRSNPANKDVKVLLNKDGKIHFKDNEDVLDDNISVEIQTTEFRNMPETKNESPEKRSSHTNQGMFRHVTQVLTVPGIRHSQDDNTSLDDIDFGHVVNSYANQDTSDYGDNEFNWRNIAVKKKPLKLPRVSRIHE